MKTIILLILVLMMGCKIENAKKEDNNIKIIDGCEYLYFENGSKYSDNYSHTLTHKGNCKNQIHIL